MSAKLREAKRKASDSLTHHAFKKFNYTVLHVWSCLLSHSSHYLAISQAANFTMVALFENSGQSTGSVTNSEHEARKF